MTQRRGTTHAPGRRQRLTELQDAQLALPLTLQQWQHRSLEMVEEADCTRPHLHAGKVCTSMALLSDGLVKKVLLNANLGLTLADGE